MLRTAESSENRHQWLDSRNARTRSPVCGEVLKGRDGCPAISLAVLRLHVEKTHSYTFVNLGTKPARMLACPNKWQ
ncbi:hypothetical protein J6590_019652, partial [Homalodisca vitripennis]